MIRKLSLYLFTTLSPHIFLSEFSLAFCIISYSESQKNPPQTNCGG